MYILAIETSCDETSIAITKNQVPLVNLVSSQEKIHAQFGGIVPEVAARKHLEMLPALFDKAIRKAKIKPDKIKIIAATQGPGLITSLLVGFEFAKTLAFALNKKFIPVNHLEGHIYSALPLQKRSRKYPILILLISGGHTQLILSKKQGDYKIVGETLDDAVGEAFDKSARLLDLGYPGGPAISKAANLGNNRAVAFSRPMLDRPNFDFSFSGLKTEVLRITEKRKGKKSGFSKQEKANIAASFQKAVVDKAVELRLV